jgi:hypothetical protein
MQIHHTDISGWIWVSDGLGDRNVLLCYQPHGYTVPDRAIQKVTDLSGSHVPRAFLKATRCCKYSTTTVGHRIRTPWPSWEYRWRDFAQGPPGKQQTRRFRLCYAQVGMTRGA